MRRCSDLVSVLGISEPAPLGTVCTQIQKRKEGKRALLCCCAAQQDVRIAGMLPHTAGDWGLLSPRCKAHKKLVPTVSRSVQLHTYALLGEEKRWDLITGIQEQETVRLSRHRDVTH